MLRLYDPQAAAVTDVVPIRRGQLHTRTAGQPGKPADLRSCLLADLVRRVCERHQLLVSTFYATGGSNEADAALRTAWDGLNIHPLQPPPAGADPPDIVIGGDAQPGGSRWLRSGPVQLPGDLHPAPVQLAGAYTAAVAGRGLDPLALRLAFLSRPYRKPAVLTWDDLAAADQLLSQWRAQVAAWAYSPSKPMCAQYTGDVLSAFDDDLDTPAALATLDALAKDPEIPPGSKFETFAFLDRLLGLDLARDVGR